MNSRQDRARRVSYLPTQWSQVSHVVVTTGFPGNHHQPCRPSQTLHRQHHRRIQSLLHHVHLERLLSKHDDAMGVVIGGDDGRDSVLGTHHGTIGRVREGDQHHFVVFWDVIGKNGNRHNVTGVLGREGQCSEPVENEEIYRV